LRSLAVSLLLVSAMTAGAACEPRGGPAGPAPATGPPDGAVPAAGAPRPPGGNRADVVRVVDGDTLIARLPGGDERVRLIGIDTPESAIPDSPVECFGPESSARLAELLPPASPVELVRDVEARDDYGRLLAYVFRAEDDLFVNLAMVAEGYANPLSIAPNTTFAEDFDRAAAAARASRLGLWAACPDPGALFGSVARR
jgi:micrococcal nuclease